VLEYDGTAYQGFQRQGSRPTIQGMLHQALKALTGAETRTIGAGRTDTGAHARGQVVSFTTGSALPTATFVSGLNAYLPDDIAVQHCREAAPGFDARRKASSRWYRYTVLRRPVRSALDRAWTHQVRIPLDIEAMTACMAALEGKHDFASFTTPEYRAHTHREILRAEIGELGSYLYFDFEATAFLPQQVRRTVAALLQVGMGRVPKEPWGHLLEAPKLGAAGSGVPAGGLCLMAVRYPPPYDDLAPDLPFGMPLEKTQCTP
jgi:tRNA pseudouridine38-40 synthase